MSSLGDSLYHHLLGMMYAVPPGSRFGAYWTMNKAWHDELERLFGDSCHNPNFSSLLGYRIEIVNTSTEGFPVFFAPDKYRVSPTVPEHHHDLDGREVAEALAKYLRTVH